MDNKLYKMHGTCITIVKLRFLCKHAVFCQGRFIQSRLVSVVRQVLLSATQNTRKDERGEIRNGMMCKLNGDYCSTDPSLR